MAARLHGELSVTMGDGSRPLGDDALRRRGETMGTMATRRAEAVQALRAWPWLDELRLRFDLAIEIIGPDLEYIFDPLPELHSSGRLRNSTGVLSERDHHGGDGRPRYSRAPSSVSGWRRS
jgi:hypothetical protein